MLNEIIPLMKNIVPGSLPSENISHLNETLSKIDQTAFKTLLFLGGCLSGWNRVEQRIVDIKDEIKKLSNFP